LWRRRPAAALRLQGRLAEASVASAQIDERWLRKRGERDEQTECAAPVEPVDPTFRRF